MHSLTRFFICVVKGRIAYCKLSGWISASGKAATADGEQDPRNWPGGEDNSGRSSWDLGGDHMSPPSPKCYCTWVTDLANLIPNPFKRGVRTKTDRSSAWAPRTIKNRSVLGGRKSYSVARAVGLLLERPKTVYHLGNVAHEDFCETVCCLCPSCVYCSGSQTRRRIFPAIFWRCPRRCFRVTA